MRSPLVRCEMLNPLACSLSETGGVARRLPDCGRWDFIRRRAWSRNEEIDRDGPGMPVVRAPVPGSPRRFPQRFCCGAVRTSPLGRASCRSRRLDRRSRQEWPPISVHTSPKRQLTRAATTSQTTVAPAEAAELLHALLAVPSSEGWPALAAAMSDELFERLKRWHAARLAKHRPHVRSGAG